MHPCMTKCLLLVAIDPCRTDVTVTIIFSINPLFSITIPNSPIVELYYCQHYSDIKPKRTQSACFQGCFCF